MEALRWEEYACCLSGIDGWILIDVGVLSLASIFRLSVMDGLMDG